MGQSHEMWPLRLANPSCRCRLLQQEWCSCWWQERQCRGATWSCSLTGVTHNVQDLLWPDVGGKHLISVCIKEHCKVPVGAGSGFVLVDLVVTGPGFSSTSPHLSSKVLWSCCRWKLGWSKDFNKSQVKLYIRVYEVKIWDNKTKVVYKARTLNPHS